MKDPRPLCFPSAMPGAPVSRVGVLFLATVLLTGVCRAQLPNDTCGGAIYIDEGPNNDLSNVGATVFNSLPMGCALTNSAVWFQFVNNDGPQTVTFSTCGTGGSLADTVLQVLAVSGGTNLCLVPVPIDCNDDSCGGERSSVAVAAGLDAQYFIRVAGKGLLSNQGTFGIQVTTSPPPAPNDSCSTAIDVVPGFNGPFWNDGAGVLNTFPMPCALSNSVVWFKYTANGDGPRTFSTCGTGGSLSDTVLQVLKNVIGCAVPIPLGCNNDSCGGLRSSVTVNVDDGDEYFVRVAGSGLLANQGSFGLLVYGAPPANNECVGATEVFAPGGLVDYNNVAATTSGSSAAFCNLLYNSDVWFKWVATCDGMTTFSTCAPPSSTSGWPPELQDTVLQVLSGTCGSLLGLGQNCNDNACGANGFKSSVTVPVTSGTTYFIRVGDYGGVATYGEFRLSIDTGQGGGFASIPTGCGSLAPQVVTSGCPMLGGSVSYDLQPDIAALPLMWFGFPTSLPLCPPAACTLGATLLVVFPVDEFSATIPNDPSLSGLVLAVQGAWLSSSTGCPTTVYGIPFRTSNTIVTTIG